MLVPAVIFVACLVAGVAGGARWLPDLAVGPVGGVAFFVVCGLLGAALGLVGLHVYSIVDELNHLGGFGGIRKGDILATGLESMLWDAGSLFGLAFVVYLLAPSAGTLEEPVPEAAA
jgi:hypothetical protein